MSVYVFRVILTRAMKQILHLRELSLENLEIFDLCLESVPDQEVLDPHHFYESRFWHCALKVLFDTQPLLRALLHLVCLQDIFPL